jgi:TnpA family transposase
LFDGRHAAAPLVANRTESDKRPHPFEKASSYPVLDPLIGDRINVAQIESQWDELLRLATSIRQGTMSGSRVRE